MANFYDTYYQELKSSFDSGNQSTRYNSDRAHNAVIMSFMLDHSNMIDMYCGQMSVFRSRFFQNINNQNEENDDTLGDKIQAKVINSLTSFLTKEGTKLRIILENKPPKEIEDFICEDIMKEAYKRGKLEFRTLPESFPPKKALNHFAVNEDSMYRIEDDKDAHTAVCCFYYKDNVNLLKNNFNVILSYAEEYKPEKIAC